MKHVILPLFASITAASHVSAHEAVGRSGLKEPLGVEIESEFYAGERGYLHGGFGMIAPLNEEQQIGVVGHFVKEESGEEIFPSIGAEFVQDLGNGAEVEAFSFGYLQVEDQSAWALGLRGRKRFECGGELAITPFFGPSYARVRAIDEDTESQVSISHLMLLGGVAIEKGPIECTIFGSHSFFSRDSVGLETHVDLEEMTHFAAYENNDGFARDTVGGEFSYSPTDWLTLTARYAAIFYEKETRHSIAFTPAVNIGEHLEVFAGVQLLRGDGPDNDLVMTGVGYSF
jgi:hypothetical protein